MRSMAPRNQAFRLLTVFSSVVYTFRDDKHTGNILGCDYAGYVEKCGLGVERFKPGDRVAGTVFGGVLPNTGSFAEYSVADAGLAVHLPETTTFEEGATLGITGSTAGLVLWRYLGIPFPGSEAPRDEKWVNIYYFHCKNYVHIH